MMAKLRSAAAVAGITLLIVGLVRSLDRIDVSDVLMIFGAGLLIGLSLRGGRTPPPLPPARPTPKSGG
jgi:hypothetical protein